MTVSRSVRIDVDPDAVYRAVSDPRQTNRWSPENTAARFDVTSESLPLGATFVGSNKRFAFRWVTRCEVVEATPGVAFAFRVQQIGRKEPKLTAAIALWAYRLRAVDGGTEVTEEWTDLRAAWPDAAARAFDFIATRGSRFAEFNARNIETTLANLKRELERHPATG